MPTINEIKTGAIKTSTYTQAIADFLQSLTEKHSNSTLEFAAQTVQKVPTPRSVSMVLLSLDETESVAPHQKLFITHTVAQMQKKGATINVQELSAKHFLVGEFSEKEINFAVIFGRITEKIAEKGKEVKEQEEAKATEKKTSRKDKIEYQQITPK